MAYTATQIDLSIEEVGERIQDITDKCTQPQLARLDKAIDDLAFVVSDIETEIQDSEDEDNEEEEDEDE